jgi:hypothetical protein
MLIAIVALCCVCSALPAGAVDADHLIRPGVGIGPVHIGGTLDDAERAWGEPTKRYVMPVKTSPEDDFTTYSWEHAQRSDVDGLEIDVLDRTGTIIRVSVIENRWFTTAGGTVTSAGANWTGSTPAWVRREFGAPDPGRGTLIFHDVFIDITCGKTDAWHYRQRGIHFYFCSKPGDSKGPVYVDIILVAAPNAALH